MNLRITRVVEGDDLSRPVKQFEWVNWKAPEDGLLVNGPGISLYLRESEVREIVKFLEDAKAHQAMDLEAWKPDEP
jgi:hypothetical protein